MLVGNNELATAKNAGEFLAILIAMWMWWCDAIVILMGLTGLPL